MTSKIRILSSQTINQIAAGEVIENPASLIKELVENALDAGALKIIVEIEGGGLQLIKVSDDGCGMGPEDALLSLERHATSKIRESDDLFTVGTMGFRGEALASIASISKMTLKTSLEEGPGTQIYVEAGKVESVEPCARVRGTTIEVRQLFYNVPARRKFQKAPSACAADITKMMSALSLANPFVSFSLYQQEEEILNLPAVRKDFFEALKERAAKVLGEEFLEGCQQVEVSDPLFSLKGFVGSFQNTRPNRSLQYQFVNGRAVVCPIVSYAVKDAFGTRIEVNRFPVYALHLTIAKEYVDVNVHPQKKEIRLREERWLKETIQKKIQDLFMKEEAKESFVMPAFSPVFEDSPSFLKADWEPVMPAFQEEKRPLEQPSFMFETRPRVIGLYEHFLWVDAASLTLACFPKEGVVFVDLKAAAARVLFDSLTSKENKVPQQLLLLPLTVGGSLAEIEEIGSCLEELQAAGFSLQKGRQCFLVEAIPASLEEEEAVEFIRSFASSEEKGLSWEQRQERKLVRAVGRMACFRQNAHTLMSAEALLSALLKTSSPQICPRGGTILTWVGKDDLQKLFVPQKK